MQSITSHSIPIKEVLTDLAYEMGVDVCQSCDDYSLEIPESFGEGTIRGMDFSNGMGIILYNCNFKNDLEIRFILDKVHPLKFLFCETGGITHTFENETEEHYLGLLQNIIVASCKDHGHVLQFKGGRKTKVNSLEINRAKFLVNMDCELKSLETTLEHLFRDVDAKDTFYYHGSYSLQMADLFVEMDGEGRKSFMEKIFLEGMAFRMLGLQILQYNDDMDGSEHKSILRKFEMILVKEAAAIINGEILDFSTVPQLALVVGINSNKLQNGFKELYGSTVNEYVHSRRLDLSINLLKNSEFTISEIVFIIGLSSKSYFSKIFKDKYGISPSISRKNGKNGSNGNNCKNGTNHKNGK